MRTTKRSYFFLSIGLLIIIINASCSKNEIQFGTNLGESFTQVSQIDSVSINLSTVQVDSFSTSSGTGFLAGRYKDPYLGIISAKPFFQFSRPADISMPADAVYDSLCFIAGFNNYSYGDTSKKTRFVVHELGASIDYTYGSKLYNTSKILEKSIPLGSKTTSLSPARDSIFIRLDDTKGKDLFDKMRQGANELQSADQFASYFKGISIEEPGTDTSAIYGINATAEHIKIRLYYHTTIPYPLNQYRDFAYDNSLHYFTQILSDRNDTPLSSINSKEISSSQTNNEAFSQAASGLLLKMNFPSLREILKLDTTIRLLSATLILKVAPGSYDPYKFKLPSSLFLVQTDATNSIGGAVQNSSGTLYAQPFIDNIYNTTTSYSFDVTNYVNGLLTNSASQNNGFFLLENYPGTLSAINRVIISDSQKESNIRSKLVLSVLTIKN